MDTQEKQKPTITTKLDKSSLAAMPDDKLMSLGLTPEEIRMLRAMPDTQISSMVPLATVVGNARATSIQPLLDYVPEVDVHGNRRCVFLEENGKRCEAYTSKDSPVCRKHKHKAKELGTYFRSAKLRETYDNFATSPEKMRCDGELALMRTMLTTLLEKLNEDNTNLEMVGAIIAITEKITNTIDKMAKLEKVTPEQLNRLMMRMVDVASKYVPSDKLSDFAKDVENIDLEDRPLRTNNGLPFMPEHIEEAVVEESPTERKDMAVQRKALLDIAERMGVTVDETK